MIYQRIVSRATGRTPLVLALLSPVLATLMLGVHFLASGMYIEIKQLVFLIATYMLISAAIMCIVSFVNERRKAYKCAMLEQKTLEEGYAEEFFVFCKKYVDKIACMRKKVRAAACLAMYYADAKRYDEANELMKQIELIHLKDKERCIYYVTVCYIQLVSDNAKAAAAALASDTELMLKYSEKRKGRTALGCAIELVTALTCFDVQREDMTEKLLWIRENTSKPEIASVCSYMLSISLVYEKQASNAKRLAADSFANAPMYGARCRARELMGLIEDMYDIEKTDKEN